MKTQRAAVAATWALAAAAVLLILVSWARWRNEQNRIAQAHPPSAAKTGTLLASAASPVDLGESVIASNDSENFTLLPGSVPSAFEDATIVHLQMQRAALGSLGLMVNEEHAGDWIQVDLLIGDDGLPQAVRLPESSTPAQ